MLFDEEFWRQHDEKFALTPAEAAEHNRQLRAIDTRCLPKDIRRRVADHILAGTITTTTLPLLVGIWADDGTIPMRPERRGRPAKI
jgi:hypothetical protein